MYTRILILRCHAPPSRFFTTFLLAGNIICTVSSYCSITDTNILLSLSESEHLYITHWTCVSWTTFSEATIWQLNLFFLSSFLAIPIWNSHKIMPNIKYKNLDCFNDHRNNDIFVIFSRRYFLFWWLHFLLIAVVKQTLSQNVSHILNLH